MNPPRPQDQRRSGVLLHPSSLPGDGGIGCLGAEARRFIDWLAEAGQSVWQILPLGPTGYGNSPYAALSAFAGNPLLIDLEPLVERGWITAEETAPLRELPRDRVDFGRLVELKPPLLRKAWDRFQSENREDERAAFHAFCDQNNDWLHDDARFAALKERHQLRPWTEWEPALIHRDPQRLRAIDEEVGPAIGAWKFAQWIFQGQWAALRQHARDKGVVILGDIPIFVAHDSADVWARQELFFLDEDGQPTVVAGVPPDYFSETGQLWGNPLYRWEEAAEAIYPWWLARLRKILALVDWVRIDHFRGFEAYWEIPGDAETAVSGRWVKGPGNTFFDTVRAALGESLPIIAEDLGEITPPVLALRERYRLPGMKVLHFAYGSDANNPFHLHHHEPDGVAYLGTHDNNTTVGWLDEIRNPPPGREDRVLDSKNTREALRRYHAIELSDPNADIVWRMIGLLQSSVARVAVVAFQDLLILGADQRMNVPSVPGGNWEWRAGDDAFSPERAARLRALSALYDRCSTND